MVNLNKRTKTSQRISAQIHLLSQHTLASCKICPDFSGAPYLFLKFATWNPYWANSARSWLTVGGGIATWWCGWRLIKYHPCLLLWLLNAATLKKRYVYNPKLVWYKLYCCLSSSQPSGELASLIPSPVWYFLCLQHFFLAHKLLSHLFAKLLPWRHHTWGPITYVQQEGLFVCLNIFHSERDCDTLKCNPEFMSVVSALKKIILSVHVEGTDFATQ